MEAGGWQTQSVLDCGGKHSATPLSPAGWFTDRSQSAYGKHDPAGRDTGNSRNGTSPKTLTSALGLPVFAQGTAFTYQGRLLENSSPASGAYDLRFTLYDSTHNPVIQGLNEKVEIGSQMPEARRWRYVWNKG